MVFELEDTSKVEKLFEGFEDTCILSCLDEGLCPRRDAANMMSVRLARKFGYELRGEYVCFGVE